MSEGPGPGKKRLKDLRVTDLKNQLEKRGLATSGVKAVLLERLQKQLEEEGINVEEFDFGAPAETSATAADTTKETETPPEKKIAVNGNETGQEEDAIHLMIEDEENLFDEEESSTAVPASPPRPETAPVIQPFTSSDTISLSSRNKAPSENSSMLVNPDESESVGSSKSLREQESPSNGDTAEEESAKRGRNLWVSGLASSYRATDLKKVFSTHGKVIGAKVVTNTRTTGARCYGYVTMGTYDEASECIKHLNKTELHNRVITVERAKSGESGPPKKEEEGNSKASSQEKDKTEEKEPSVESKSTEEPKRTSNTRESSPSQSGRSRSPYRGRKPRYSNHHRFRRLAPGDARNKIRDISPRREDRTSRPGVLTVSQIREQREKEVDDARRWRERAREAEESRRLRDREIRRLEDAEYRREMERRRRNEEERFERERLELRREREKIEREKAELLKFERERQRFERERLQREKEELERLRWEQSRLEDTRRAMKRPAAPSHEHHHNPIRGNHDGGSRMKRAPLPVPNEHHNNHHQVRGNSSDGGFYDDRKRDISGSGMPMPTQRYNNPNSYSNSSNRGYDRPRYESSRGGFSGGRREDYRGGDRSSNGNRHYSSPWDSSTSGGSSKSNYMMGSDSEWNSRPQNSSQSVIPRPPILSGISMGSSGANSYGGNMGSSNGYNNGFGANSHNQQQQHQHQHRYDNYKNNMGPKRHY